MTETREVSPWHPLDEEEQEAIPRFPHRPPVLDAHPSWVSIDSHDLHLHITSQVEALKDFNKAGSQSVS